MGCDAHPRALQSSITISIHAARVGCDMNVRYSAAVPAGFQSTQPEWAATISDVVTRIGPLDFNPRSPSGLRPSSPNSFTTKFTFQSTQPEWAATSSYPKSLGFVIFQSTQPEWAATKLFVSLCLLNFDFNPRSPSGLRLRLVRSLINCLLFQSTQPEWAATVTTT